MKIVNLILLILLIFIAGCGPSITKKNVITGQAVYEKDEIVLNSEQYIDMIVHDDIELKALARHLTKQCDTDTCRLFVVYRYVVNFDYAEDIGEDVQSAEETLELKTGDCEDLTIVLMSLLENIGVKTYFVLAENHVYSLACNADKDELVSYIHSMHSYKDISITYYDAFGNENCIVMDATAGSLGYPGYDAGVIGEKTAVDVLTEDVEVLE